MVRQRSRRTLEEVYGNKIETAKLLPDGNGKIKGLLQTNMQDNGYIITSNRPYHTIPTTLAPPASVTSTMGGVNSSRRKSARPYGKSNSQKYRSGEEKDDCSKDMENVKAKTCRLNNAGTNASPINYENKTHRPPGNDTKNYEGLPINSQNHQQQSHNTYRNQQHSHHHHQNQHHHHPTEDEDKDDDTEEFFQLIRQTVEKAIGKSISELLNRNFRDLSQKVDRFSADLKNTNELMKKMQMDLNNKIVHYGEETSRHFRYLCMKSEYDKMFYQHQTMMSTASVVPINHDLAKPNNIAKSSCESDAKTEDDQKTLIPCTCRSVSNTKTPIHPQTTISPKDPGKSSSDDQSIGHKSSDIGMREILDQIQRFCAQMQTSKDKHKDEKPSISGVQRRMKTSNGDILESYHQAKAMRLNDHFFQDDDFIMSSDSSTPRSEDNEPIAPQNYGNMTVRTSNAMRNHEIGAGGDGGGRIGGGDGDQMGMM
ncbi:uncharacterized protein LOC142220376 [Haematobia irritans]|uniref:uncharacterized protein LOC142220376 n=1 Tax=Haematobia irritans TaxID=7368 RepID=UPI003F509DB2